MSNTKQKKGPDEPGVTDRRPRQSQRESPAERVRREKKKGAAIEKLEHEGATEEDVGDRRGPGPGYNAGARQKNPKQR